MIEIRNICKTYKTKKGVQVQALKNINLTIEDRGMVFILGKSGSGKSTLLHLLGGLDTYDSGELVIKGKSSLSFKQSDFDSYRNTLIGFIFQDYNILDEFSVGRNIELALELQNQKFNKSQIEKALIDVGLEGYYNRKPNELSGGQKQRVAIARALIKSPEIIMADEPTGALDSKTGIQVFNTLKNLSRDKLVIVVSHDREFAEIYADRIIELADGEIISDVQKYKTAPREIVAGVNIVDDKAVIIKQGHNITMSEFYYITKVLNNITKQSDAVIPLSEKSTKEVKKQLKLSDDGSSTYFDRTNIHNLPIRQYGPNDLQLKKSHMPVKDSIRMGASALKHKKFRLFLTILLSSLAFAMFGFVSALSSYNLVSATYRSIKESNINYLSIVKQEKDDYDYYNMAPISQKDITNYKTKFSRTFIPSFTLKDDSYETSYYNSGVSFGNSTDNYSNANFYKTYANGFACINNQNLTDFGYTIIGNLPAETTNEVKEIAITDYQLEVFKKLGYQSNKYNSETGEYETAKITKATDIINREIRLYLDVFNAEFDGYYATFKVVGVINTNTDFSRYETLKNENFSYDVTSQFLIGEFEAITKLSLVNTMFINENVFKNASKNYNFIQAPVIDEKSDTELINYVVKHKEGNYKFQIQNAASYILNSFDEILTQVAQVLFYVGIGFACFASLLLFNYITTSISYKKREIGILRAVGARSSDVFGIFFNESLIIALINSVLAIAISAGVIIFLNGYLRSQGLLVSLLSFGPLQVGLILGVAVLAAFISTFIPVTRIAHKKPIDAIRNK